MKNCTTHHHACDCREERFRIALTDAITRPKGIIPDTAEEFIRKGDLRKAVWRTINKEQE